MMTNSAKIIQIIESNSRLKNVEIIKATLAKKSNKLSVDFKSCLFGVNYTSTCVVDLNKSSVEFF